MESFFAPSFCFTRPPIFLPVHNGVYPSKWQVDGSLHKAMPVPYTSCTPHVTYLTRHVPHTSRTSHITYLTRHIPHTSWTSHIMYLTHYVPTFLVPRVFLRGCCWASMRSAAEAGGEEARMCLQTSCVSSVRGGRSIASRFLFFITWKSSRLHRISCNRNCGMTQGNVQFPWTLTTDIQPTQIFINITGTTKPLLKNTILHTLLFK